MGRLWVGGGSPLLWVELRRLHPLKTSTHAPTPPLPTPTSLLQLLDELMAAGAERCMQPLLLDPSVLDRILAASAAARAPAAQPHMSLL